MTLVLHIEGIPRTEENKKDCQLSSEEGDPLNPTQARLYIDPMTLWASPRIEVRSETLSLVVSEGSKDNSKGSQSSGSSVTTQLQVVSPRKNITQYTMVGVDPTLRMPVFHGLGTEDPEQHLFFYEAI